MKLTNRLKVIASLVPGGSIVADIGTDHGYLPIYLLKNNDVRHVYATDVNRGPLQAAKEFVTENKEMKRVDLILGDGLSCVKKKNVDGAVIAGMGGILIQEIIQRDFDKAKALSWMILQPMTAPEKLREYLMQNGFEIIREELAKEQRRIYQIMLVKYTGESTNYQNSFYYHIGEKNVKENHPLTGELIEQYKAKQQKILRKCEEKTTPATQKRIEEVLALLRQIEEVEQDYANGKNTGHVE